MDDLHGVFVKIRCEMTEKYKKRYRITVITTVVIIAGLALFTNYSHLGCLLMNIVMVIIIIVNVIGLIMDKSTSKYIALII